MDDVLRPEAAFRRDRLDDRDRPLDGQLVAIAHEPRLLRQLALQRVDECLAARDAAPGQQPVLAAALLVANEENRPAPVQERRDPDARLGAHGYLPEEPRPPAPRWLSGSSSTSTSSIRGSSTTTSWAMRIPGSTTNVSSRSVLCRITLISPR